MRSNVNTEIKLENKHQNKHEQTQNKFLQSLVWLVRLNGLVVSALGIRARGPGFDSRVVPLFYWVATVGKLFTHIASPVSLLQETGVRKGSFRRLSGYGEW